MDPFSINVLKDKERRDPELQSGVKQIHVQTHVTHTKAP